MPLHCSLPQNSYLHSSRHSLLGPYLSIGPIEAPYTPQHTTLTAVGSAFSTLLKSIDPKPGPAQSLYPFLVLEIQVWLLSGPPTPLLIVYKIDLRCLLCFPQRMPKKIPYHLASQDSIFSILPPTPLALGSLSYIHSLVHKALTYAPSHMDTTLSYITLRAVNLWVEWPLRRGDGWVDRWMGWWMNK